MNQEQETKPKTPRKYAPKVQTELEKAQTQFDAFDANIKEMTMDRMNQAPKQEVEPQTKMSEKEIQRAKDIYLKPIRSISPGAKEEFNEKFREDYNFQKEYVQFIAEHKELIGENIEIWTKPFGGMNAEYWEVPSNKPVWGPRYLAEQLKRKCYHRLSMQNRNITDADGYGQYYGSLAVDTTVQRLDANPVSQRRSVFMGANNF